MKIALGSDHAGFELKAHLIDRLQGQGHEIVDLGTDSTESVDYPEFCAAVARTVVAGDADPVGPNVPSPVTLRVVPTVPVRGPRI